MVKLLIKCGKSAIGERTDPPIQHFIGLSGSTAKRGFAFSLLFAAEEDRHSVSGISASLSEETTPAQEIRYGCRRPESDDGSAREEKPEGKEPLGRLLVSFQPWHLDGLKKRGSGESHVGETGMIVMRHRNVWIDSRWLPTLNYSTAKRAYHEWL